MSKPKHKRLAIEKVMWPNDGKRSAVYSEQPFDVTPKAVDYKPAFLREEEITKKGMRKLFAKEKNPGRGKRQRRRRGRQQHVKKVVKSSHKRRNIGK